MARTTKIELEQQLIATQRDNAALRAEVSALRAEVDRLSRTEPRTWPTVKQHLAGGKSLPAHFAAAREAAMRLGRSVKVSAT